MVGLKIDNPSHWENLKPLIRRLPFVTVVVVVWTMRFVAAIAMLANVELKELRMVLLLLPPMTVWALHFRLASLFVFVDGFL